MAEEKGKQYLLFFIRVDIKLSFDPIRCILNNYWIRLYRISIVIQTRQILSKRPRTELDNNLVKLNKFDIRYIAASNNCFIFHVFYLFPFKD